MAEPGQMDARHSNKGVNGETVANNPACEEGLFLGGLL